MNRNPSNLTGSCHAKGFPRLPGYSSVGRGCSCHGDTLFSANAKRIEGAVDPSHTTSIRRTLLGKVSARMNLLFRRIQPEIALFVEDQQGPLPTWEDSKKLAEEFLSRTLQPMFDEIMGTDWRWFRQWTKIAFRRGTLRAYQELKKIRVQPATSVVALHDSRRLVGLASSDWWDEYYSIDDPENPAAEFKTVEDAKKKLGGKWSVLLGMLGTSASLQAWRYVDLQSILSLGGLEEDVKTGILETIVEGIQGGYGPVEVSRVFRKRFGISKLRGMTIARTEMMRAYNSSLLAQYRAAGIAGVRVLVEWSTAKDAKVCPYCREYGEKVYTIEEMEGVLPAHPNCRCVPIPVVPLPPE